MIGIPIPPTGGTPGGGGDTWGAVVALIAVVLMGLVLVGFAWWAGRAHGTAPRELTEELEEPVALPNAA
jgi:hypothetical protein